MTLKTDPRSARPDLGDFSWARELRRQRQAWGGPTITGIVHTRNEEYNLPDALRSLAWVDDLLVVDMESEDGTVAIARDHGAEVLNVEDTGFVEPARNLAVATAKGDWVLVLDADERIPQTLAVPLAETARDGSADVVRLHCHVWIAGQFLKESGWLGQYHPRFFRRGCVRWSGRVHEPPEVVGRVVSIPYTPETSLIHFNYDDLSHFVTKLNRYTDKEADALEGEPPMHWRALAAHLRDEFASRWTPAADGTLSCALAFSMLFYRFLAQGKHWERLTFPEVGVPRDARAALRDLAHDGAALHEAGLAAASTGAISDGIESLRQSVLQQVNLETLNDFAVLCAQAGRRDAAAAVLQTCLELEPRYETARENLAALDRPSTPPVAEAKRVLYHVGCGDVHLDGYVNVDIRDTPAADLTADLNRLELPDPARGFFSNAFFEHLHRNARVPHLAAAREMLGPDGFICYIGLPDFRAVAQNYLAGAPGILGPTFDLYHVYRYTHGDPEGVDHYTEQLHKSLFDHAELDHLLTEAGYGAHVTFTYLFPGEHTRVTMGFFASPAPLPAEELQRCAAEFLAQFDGRFLQTASIRFAAAR